jgi:hypothetical protein
MKSLHSLFSSAVVVGVLMPAPGMIAMQQAERESKRGAQRQEIDAMSIATSAKPKEETDEERAKKEASSLEVAIREEQPEPAYIRKVRENFANIKKSQMEEQQINQLYYLITELDVAPMVGQATDDSLKSEIEAYRNQVQKHFDGLKQQERKEKESKESAQSAYQRGLNRYLAIIEVGDPQTRMNELTALYKTLESYKDHADVELMCDIQSHITDCTKEIEQRKDEQAKQKQTEQAAQMVAKRYASVQTPPPDKPTLSSPVMDPASPAPQRNTWNRGIVFVSIVAVVAAIGSWLWFFNRKTA